MQNNQYDFEIDIKQDVYIRISISNALGSSHTSDEYQFIYKSNKKPQDSKSGFFFNKTPQLLS